MPKLLNKNKQKQNNNKKEKNNQKQKTNKILNNTDFVPIILDTNFLLTMVRYKIHGLEEIKTKIKCKFFTMSRVMFELEALGKREKKIAKELLLVKQIIKNNEIKIIDSTMEDVDTELVEKSKQGNIIATNDKNLRERIKKAGGKSIYIRSLNFIETSEIEQN